MAISELYVAGYRSIRSVRLKMKPVNVLVGPNGCGKTNLYRSMVLLATAAGGRLARTLVDEGGMPSVLWAGARKKGPVRLTLGVVAGQMNYEIQCGLPIPGCSMFDLDPMVKEETLTFTNGRTRTPLLERGVANAWARDADGRRVTYPLALAESESALTQLREPHRFPHLSALRQELLSWRFYHHFATDAGSPLREPQSGVRTPVLSQDGVDLAAALRTIVEIGDAPGLEDALDHAFPGAELCISSTNGRFDLGLRMPEFRRVFDARELSDGTLRYLCLLAALFSPRPPTVLALNEPETSIHPDLLEPLGRLVARAARDSQLWITTHSEVLAGYVERFTGAAPVRLEKVDGETRIVGQRLIEADDEPD